MSMILTMWGCSENEVLETADDGLPRTIEFSTYVRQSTRATEMTLTELKSQGFGVFAYTSDDDTSPYINNVQVTGADNKDGSTSWASIKTYYWPSSSSTTVDFYAYAPYSSSMKMDAAKKTIEYSVNTDITQQEDLLYASNVTQNERKVTFTFGHALACVGFRVQLGANSSSDYEALIEKVTILADSVHTGTFSCADQKWSSISDKKTSTQYSFEPNVTLNSTNTYVDMSDCAMILPQSFKPTITVLCRILKDNKDFVPEQNLKITSKSEMSFEMGKKYTLAVTLDLDFKELNVILDTDGTRWGWGTSNNYSLDYTY